MPAGTAAGLGVLSSYLFALNVARPRRSSRRGRSRRRPSSLVGLYLIVALEAQGRRRSFGISALCLGLAAVYGAVLVLPSTRSFFALSLPSPAVLAVAAAGAGVAIAGLWLSDEQFVPSFGQPGSRTP